MVEAKITKTKKKTKEKKKRVKKDFLCVTEYRKGHPVCPICNKTFSEPHKHQLEPTAVVLKFVSDNKGEDGKKASITEGSPECPLCNTQFEGTHTHTVYGSVIARWKWKPHQISSLPLLLKKIETKGSRNEKEAGEDEQPDESHQDEEPNGR